MLVLEVREGWKWTFEVDFLQMATMVQTNYVRNIITSYKRSYLIGNLVWISG
jgi:hypothetical protein